VIVAVDVARDDVVKQLDDAKVPGNGMLSITAAWFNRTGGITIEVQVDVEGFDD
jgi:hypothetical protein